MTSKYHTPLATIMNHCKVDVSDVELIKHPQFDFLVIGFRQGKERKIFSKPIDVTLNPENVVHDKIFRFGYYRLPAASIGKLRRFIGQNIELYFRPNKSHLPFLLHAERWYSISF